MRRLILLFVWFAARPASTHGQSVAPAVSATRASTSPIIDGRLDEAAWVAEGALIESLVQREPYEGTPASERTRVRLLYDDQALYVAAWLFDRDASTVVVGQNRRDASLTDSDAFVIVLDTYRDRQNGFVFGTTPGGIEYDGQVSNEGQAGSGTAS
jgi:hypothetical protein